jgi:hypothetical protein
MGVVNQTPIQTENKIHSVWRERKRERESERERERERTKRRTLIQKCPPSRFLFSLQHVIINLAQDRKKYVHARALDSWTSGPDLKIGAIAASSPPSTTQEDTNWKKRVRFVSLSLESVGIKISIT